MISGVRVIIHLYDSYFSGDVPPPFIAAVNEEDGRSSAVEIYTSFQFLAPQLKHINRKLN